MLCGRGDAFSADILARSLYETALATYFVLEEEFRYSAGDVPKGAPIKAGEDLPRLTRAKFYMAYQTLRTERHAKKLLEAQGFDELAASIAARYDEAILVRIKAEIGEQWSKVLSTAPTYSGLSISKLATTLGYLLDYWYKSFYFLQSRNAHGADAFQHVRADQGPMYYSESVDTSNALYAGTSMFLVCIRSPIEHVHFGDSAAKGLADFAREYQDIW